MGNHFRGGRLAAAYCLVAVTGSFGAVVFDRPVAVADTARIAQAALTPSTPSKSVGPALTRRGPGCVSVVDGRAGTWTRRPVPAFPVGGAALVGHAVDPTSPERQLVTNGHVILASADGCSWQETWRLPVSPTARMPVNARTDRVVEVVVHPRAPHRVWAVVALGQEVAERVPVSLPLSPAAAEGRDPTSAVVLRSVDGGETWGPMRTPPLAGTPGRLALSASHPDRLFLPTATGLHASGDGGRSWQPLPAALTGPVAGRRPLDGVSAPVLASVLVDPHDPRHLYGRTSTPVHSRDGGLTWSAYPTPSGFWTGPFPGPGGAWFARQDFSTSPVLDVWHGDDTLTAVPAQLVGSPWRAAPGGHRGGMLLATWDRGNGAAFPEVSLYRVADDGRVTDVNDLSLPWVRGLVADNYGGHHLHTRTVLVSLGPRSVGQEPRGEQVRLHPFGETFPEPRRPASLDAPTLLRVEPGEDLPLEVVLDLPRRPTPLDTFFLIDTSNSFEPDIQAVAEAMADVVASVRKVGIDAWFGVGELGTRDARRYRRLADLEAPGIGLQRGFERLRTGGSRESHLIALHQAATGSGVAGTSGPEVPAGQDPTWRAGTLRTVVVVTDVQYSDEDDPEAPSRREVYDALAARGVRVIGLEVVREGGDDGVPGGYAAVEAADAASTTAPTPARTDLEELARETGSFAPPGGIDCRDNGTVEIREGDPLVCTTTALHVGKLHTIGDVLRRVLLAQVDQRHVRVAVDGEPLATPAGWRARVDVRRDQRLPFAGSVSCTPDQAGQVMPLRLTATLDGEPLSRAVVQVACGRTAAPPTSQNPPPPQQQTPPGTFEPPPGPPALATAPPPPVLPAPVGGVAPGTFAAASSTAPGAASGTAGGTAPAASAGTAPATAAGQAPGHQSATAPGVLGAGASQDDARLATVRLLCAGLLTSAAAMSLQRRRSRQLRLTRNHS